MRQGQQRSRCDRAGGTPPPSSLAASPLVSENSPVKTPCLPRFFSHLYSQCLLSFCIMPPHPPLASLFLSLLSLLPYLTPVPPPSPPPVLLCLSSSCIASPAPWCGTGNQNSAHIHTCARRLARTHTHK